MPEIVPWPNFAALDHEIRTLALVGQYLQEFAFMENEVDKVMATLMELNTTQQFVLSPNIPFHNKIHILTTLLKAISLQEQSKNDYLVTLNHILRASSWRNNIAHSPFLPSNETDGVMFYVVKAQGELKFPDMDWPIARFEQEYNKLRTYQNKTAGIHEDVAQAKAKIQEAIKQLSFPNSAPSEPETPNLE